MFVALNSDNNRVWADKTLQKDAIYTCPVCRGQVRLRAGSLNAPHFAHVTACTDDFSQEMSEWHKGWQELFPAGNREVVISHNGETHRADVLCYGTVIEFQHSTISKEEFSRRNKFYTDAGYKVVWIFDAIDLFTDNDKSGRMFLDGNWRTPWDSGDYVRWKHPWRYLNGFLPQDEKSIHIFFNTVARDISNEGEITKFYIRQVVDVPLCHIVGIHSWGRFLTSNLSPSNCNELKEWLRIRWEQEKLGLPENPVLTKLKIPSLGSKYTIGNEMVDAATVGTFLRENEPFHVIEAYSRNNPQNIMTRLCLAPHQKPYIDEDLCLLGCYKCLCVIEERGAKYILCKKNLPPIYQQYNGKIIRRTD